MHHALRWILLVPSVLASWVGVFYVFAEYHRHLTAPCDSDAALPECSDPLHLLLVDTLPSVGAAVSAALVLVVTFVIAPKAKVKAMRLCYCVGAALAVTGAWVNAAVGSWDMFSAACSALVAGAVTVHFISQIAQPKQRTMTPNTSLERMREG